MFTPHTTFEFARMIKRRAAVCGAAITICILFAAAPVTVLAQQQGAGDKATPAAVTPAPASSPEQDAAAADAAPPRDARYRIGIGDSLDIRIFNRPQYSRDNVKVDNLGFIRMPLIAGDIRAACYTEIELGEVVAQAYRKYLKKPHVEVFVRDYQSKPVTVLGAVNSAGRFQLRREIRLQELLTQFAGGPSLNAGNSIQIVHVEGERDYCEKAAAESPQQVAAEGDAEDKTKIVSYSLQAAMLGQETANPYVRPGDVITVVKADEAYLIGNVLRPMTIKLNEPVTLSRAVAMAGGLAPDTKSKKVSIVRLKPDGTEREKITVDLAAINKLQADDILLQPNDIVDVPTSTVKRTMRTIMTSLVPSVATMPLRVIQ